jgi:hypothetical protein
MNNSPRKSINRKSSSAIQWNPNNKNWLLTEGERYDGGSLPSKAKLGKTT